MSMSYRSNTRLQSAVRFALAGGAISAAAVAQAQQKAPQVAAAGLEDIVVTGSRIAVPNEISISPVIAVTAEEIKASGATRIEDLMNSLPQVFAGQNANVSNGSDGTATLNLRGLGSQRTLVLVNGRRLGPGDPGGGSAADLNQIPAELVEKVDVLTGGASSVYGADAVSGVVNFQLNSHFEGLKVEANYGMYQHHQDNVQGVGTNLTDWNTNHGTTFPSAPANVNEGQTKNASILFGFNTADGKGNFTGYVTFRQVAAVLQSQYDYSACTLYSGFTGGSYDTGGKFGGCGGSSTSYPGGFRQVNPATGGYRDFMGYDPNTGAEIWNRNYKSTIDFSTGGLRPMTSADAYNYGPTNFFQRPDQRWTAGAFSHYEFNEHADVYSEVQFMNDRSVSQIAPSGTFNANFTLSCQNPYLSQPMLDKWCGGTSNDRPLELLVGRRNVEGGGRQSDMEHTSFRAVMGSRGKINDAWSYDAYAQVGITQLSETYLNDLSITKLNRALDAVTVAADGTIVPVGTPGSQVVCRSTLDPQSPTYDQYCVPYNIFQKGGVTQEAVNYVQIPLNLRGEVDQYIVSGNVTGDLTKYGFKLPTAADGAKVNIGAEWRQLASQTMPDEAYQTGAAAGQGSATLPVGGEIASREAFAELRVPLMDDKPFAKSMAFDTGYRYSDYSLGFRTSTYKFGLEWAPSSDIRFRASFARAVRAPNIGELFSAVTVGLDGTSDPCAGANPKFTREQCALTGVTPDLYGFIDSNSASQYNGQSGGNPHLQPETATSKGFGVGITPSFIPNLRVQIDYYDINIKNVIGSIGADNILNLCGKTGQLCDRIHRDTNGSLWLTQQGYVIDTLANTGGLKETGLDFDVGYSFNLGKYGKLRASYIATVLKDFLVSPVAALPELSYDCVGLYGSHCGTPNAKYRSTVHLTWMTPWSGLDVTLAWRHFDKVMLDQLSNNSVLRAQCSDGCTAEQNASNSYLLNNGQVSSTDAYLGKREYFDLSASMDLGRGLSMRVGANNLFDKSPPVFGGTNCGSGCNGNTMASVYDALGRYVFATLTAQF